VDPRDVLGVGPGATADEVRAAHRRLTRQLDPRRGGSAELVRIVKLAHDAIATGWSTGMPTVDPYLLFGLSAGATETEVKVAYRRLAARAHPDRGGTDELFRIVDSAYDAILHPHVPSGPRADWIPREPWPGPRPERPYRPPPEDARFHAPGWRDWLMVLGHTGLLACWLGAGAVLVVLVRFLDVEDKLLPALLLPFWVVAFWMQGRIAASGLLRALARARSSYSRQRGADPEAFLADQCLDSPVNREREDLLYEAYATWCRARGVRPLSRWVFIEKLRTLGLLHVQASAMEHGLFVGIRIRTR
jgi:hypothetical protein